MASCVSDKNHLKVDNILEENKQETEWLWDKSETVCPTLHAWVAYPVAAGTGTCQWPFSQWNIHYWHEHIGKERQRGRGGPQCVRWIRLWCETIRVPCRRCGPRSIDKALPVIRQHLILYFIASCCGMPDVQGRTCKCVRTQTVQCKSTWDCTWVHTTVAHCTVYLCTDRTCTHAQTHHTHANNPLKSNKHTCALQNHCPLSVLHTHTLRDAP